MQNNSESKNLMLISFENCECKMTFYEDCTFINYERNEPKLPFEKTKIEHAVLIVGHHALIFGNLLYK